MTETLFLSRDEVAGLASVEEYVDAVRSAYRQRGEGAPAEPRTQLPSEDPAGSLTSYVAILPETGAMGGYMYSAGFSAGDAWFMSPVFDAESGEALALVDGAYMNPLKTGSAGAVAIDALAREDASTLALIGSSTQARGQLRTAAVVRDLDEVRIYSPTAENREAFAEEFDGRLDADVHAVGDSNEAIEDADIVITATRSPEPVFDGDRLPDGAHVTAMGQYAVGKREIDVTTVERATYVPDLRARAFQDAGAFLYALEQGAVTEDHIHGELGEVVAGEVPGRTSDDEITVFDSGGTAIETVAGAYLLYEKAREAGLGTPVEMTPASVGMAGNAPE